MKDFYYILGTDINCTPDEIKEAYRKLLKKFHPDMNGGDNYFEGRFREINEAYETLNDPARRMVYDAALKKPAPFPPYSEPSPKPKKREFRTRGIDITFSIMLVLLTLVFGYYVYRSLSGISKIAKVNKITTVAAHSVRHHKKKHSIKHIPLIAAINNKQPKLVKAIIKPAKVIADTVHTHTVKPTPPVVNNIKHDNNIHTVSNTNNTGSFSAYVRGNVTGVVYMRRFDNYAADVVKVIPNNSKVLVMEKGSTYYKVMFDNEVGYVPGWTVIK